MWLVFPLVSSLVQQEARATFLYCLLPGVIRQELQRHFLAWLGHLQKLFDADLQISHSVALCNMENSVGRSSLPTKKFKGQIVCTVLRRKEILLRIFPEFGIFVFFLNFWKIIKKKKKKYIYIYFNIFEIFWLFSGPIWSAWICRQLLSSWPWPKPSSNSRRRCKWRVSGASCRSCGNCGNIRRVCIWNFQNTNLYRHTAHGKCCNSENLFVSDRKPKFANWRPAVNAERPNGCGDSLGLLFLAVRGVVFLYHVCIVKS